MPLNKYLLLFIPFNLFGQIGFGHYTDEPYLSSLSSRTLGPQIIWVEATQGVTNHFGISPPTSDGEQIKGWKDLSGNGYHLIQSGGLFREPVWKSSGGPTNGPYINYTTGAPALNLTNRAGTSIYPQPNIFFFVMRGIDNNLPFSTTGCYLNTATNQGTQFNVSTGRVLRLYNGVAEITVTDLQITNYTVVTLVCSNLVSVIRTNGVVAVGGATGLGTCSGVTLGNFFNATQAPFADFVWFEWYNGTYFTTNQIHAHEQDLGNAYNITVF